MNIDNVRFLRSGLQRIGLGRLTPDVLRHLVAQKAPRPGQVEDYPYPDGDRPAVVVRIRGVKDPQSGWIDATVIEVL